MLLIFLFAGMYAQLNTKPLVLHVSFDVESDVAYNAQSLAVDTADVGFNATGKFNGSGTFDKSQFIIMEQDDAINCSSEENTWSMWVKTTDSQAGSLVAFTIFSGTVPTEDEGGNWIGDSSEEGDVCAGPTWIWMGWNDDILTMETPCLAGQVDFAADPDNPTDAEIISDGDWHHIVFSNSLTAQDYYIDGQLVTSSENNLATDLEGMVLKIGYSNTDWPEFPFWNGEIDDFRLYGAALTANEVTELYTLVPDKVVPVGVNNRKANMGFSVYPNPASDYITVKSVQTRDIEIFNCVGQSVLRHSNVPNGGQINISGLEKGLYFVKSDFDTQDRKSVV